MHHPSPYLSSRPALVQVFVNAHGEHGNPLTIYADTKSWSNAECQRLAAQAGTSETVFVDDVAHGRVRIFVPTRRVPFAAHPLIGVAWWLGRQGVRLSNLSTDAGAVHVRTDDGGAQLRARPFQGVPWTFQELDSIDEVSQASSDGEGRHDYVWAWCDEMAGTIQARAFTSVSGTPEDEATGSAVIDLCAALRRDISVTQGRGSQLRAHWLAQTGEVVLQGNCCG